MSLHRRLGRHVVDRASSHWEQWTFVGRFGARDEAMIKLPGLALQLRPAAI